MIARLWRLWHLFRRNDVLRERAGLMLLAPTWHEQRLYTALCRALPDRDIRMQHVVGNAIIDIAIPDRRIAVEVDGAHHEQPLQRRRDRARTRRLWWRRWRVIRVPNRDVKEQLDQVVAMLVEAAR